MAISAARVTRLGLSGYATRPYGDFAGKTATEVSTGAGRGGRRYTHTFSNGLRINGTREEVEAAIRRFENTAEEVQRVVEKPAPQREDNIGNTDVTAPSDLLAEMPERAPLNIVKPPAPVAIPEFDPISDDEAVLVLLLA